MLPERMSRRFLRFCCEFEVDDGVRVLRGETLRGLHVTFRVFAWR